MNFVLTSPLSSFLFAHIIAYLNTHQKNQNFILH